MSTATEIESILSPTGSRDPDNECHTWRGSSCWSLCGTSKNSRGPADAAEGEYHTKAECRELGHKHCVVCEELGRQLGPDDTVVA
jgi:hypothetical protein